MRFLIVYRRTLILVVALLLAAVVGLVFLLLGADSLRILQVAAPAGDSRQIPIYSVQTEDRQVALTFDATWGAEYTGQLLAVLHDHDVSATFFLTNIWMEDYPEYAEDIWDGGHEIGLHSANHPDMADLSEEEIRNELEDNRGMVQSLCPDAEPRLFRPPFGSYDDTVMRVARDEMGFVPIQWSIDSLDWREVTGDYVFNRVTTLMHPGAIVLFHNNARPTAEALPDILQYLEEEEYEVLPLGELLHPAPYRIDHQGQQIPEESSGG